MIRPSARQQGRLHAAAGGLAMAAAFALGCESAPRGESADGAFSLRTAADPSLSAAEHLARLAALEQAAAQAGGLEVRLPPGVEPYALTPRSAEDSIARMTLHEVVEAIIDRHPLATIVGDTVPNANSFDDEHDHAAVKAALRHYIRGREAAIENRHLVAITEFQRAGALDPDSIAIMRELARSFLAVNNASRAADLYTHILRRDSSHLEARFSLGLLLAGQQRYEQAVALLGQPRLLGRGFTHDPAAEVLAAEVLASSLRQIGADRAFVEAAERIGDFPFEAIGQTVYVPRLQRLHQQRSELWRTVGDALCRLETYDRALAAYALSAAYPVPDPGALHPRIIYANIRLGRPHVAQLELLRVLEAEAPSLADRDIRLCAYIAEVVPDHALLAHAVLDIHRRSPSEPGPVRAAASLLPPDRAVAVLRTFIKRASTETGEYDPNVASQLLGWLGERDMDQAVQLAAGLIEERPDLAGEIISRLVFAVPDPASIIAAAKSMPPSPPAAIIESRIRALLGEHGSAWRVADEARRRWPQERALAWLMIELAALLEEPELLAAAIDDSLAFDDITTSIMRSRGARAVGKIDAALEHAENALTLAEVLPADSDLRIRAMIELAAAYAAHAQRHESEAERQQWAHEAANLAEHVLALDPPSAASDAAHELLFGLFGPSGIAADAQQFSRVARRLYEMNPASRAYGRAAGEEALLRGRYEQALERLLNLYDSDPSDTRALAMAVNAWMRWQRFDAAESWLSEQLRRRPGDPALLEQWVGLLLAQERAHEAIDTLIARLTTNENDDTARRLLESAYRATGRLDKAFPLGERRLLARPPGVRRNVELAALYGGAGRTAEALKYLTWLADHAAENPAAVGRDHLLTALAVLGRLDETGEGRLRMLTVALVEHTVEREPRSPLQVYGLGLRALARLDDLSGRFDDLVRRAALHAPLAGGTSFESALMWRELAQALVQAGHPAAAGRAVRVRILSDSPLEQDGLNLLASVALVSDAAGGTVADAQRAVEFVRDLEARGHLPQLPGIDGQATVANVLFQASNMFSLLGGREGSEHLLRKVVSLDPDHAMALNNLAYSLIERGDDDPQAAEWAERALELALDEPAILDTVGWLRYMQGFFDHGPAPGGAAPLIRRAIELDDEPSAEVLDHYGDVFWRLGERDEAIEMWSRALAVLEDPEHRQKREDLYGLIQTRGWGLFVKDPNQMYDREYTGKLNRIRAKIAAAESGETPQVAPTFEELKSPDAKPHAADE